MSVAPKKISPYKSELKIIHVGTPGIFHYPRSGMTETVCGRDMANSRMTAHTLSDYQPCLVCFEGWFQHIRVRRSAAHGRTWLLCKPPKDGEDAQGGER